MNANTQMLVSVCMAQLAGATFMASSLQSKSNKNWILLVYALLWIAMEAFQISYLTDKPLARNSAISLIVMYMIGFLILLSGWL